MREDPSAKLILRSASLAVIKVVKVRRLRLFRSDVRPLTCRRALPLDFSESKPFESSIDRNIEALLSEPSCC